MSKVLSLIIAILIATSSYGFGKTNVNEVTDLFDRHIEDKDALIEDIKRQNERAVDQIRSKESLSFIGGTDEHESKEKVQSLVDAKSRELNTIPDTNLENAGRSARVSEECRFYDENELEPDYTKPGNKLHKEDMDDIANGTSKLVGDLIGKLKEIDIDCKTEKGPIQKEPVYYIDLKREEQKNTDYDQFFCEEPRNHYSCRDELSVKCNQIIGKPSSMNITGTNLPTVNRAPGWLQLGWTDSHSHNGGRGTMYNYFVTFNVVNPEHIASFRLGSINYDDWVLIQLNGNYIWSGPHGGQILDFDPRDIPFGYKKVIIDYSGSYHSAENNRWFHATLGADMKHYLKAGSNTLSIRLIVGGKGGLIFDFSMTDRECASWSEAWREQCTLN